MYMPQVSSIRPSLNHVLKSNQFDRLFFNYLFELTNAIRRFNKSVEGMNYLSRLLSHKQVMLYFTQPSTRTFLSFQSACQILGMRTNEIRNSAISSEKKGESIEDSLRTFSSYVDLIIMRSPVAGLCTKIAKLLDETNRPVPVINAGSGPDDHPTQALLDLYTLDRSFKKRGGISKKTICLVGDLKRGRTARSLATVLTQYDQVKLILCSPKCFAIEQDLREFLNTQKKISFFETDDFESSIRESDAIYMTRIQDEYDREKGDSAKIDTSKFHLTYDHLAAIKPDCCILHPMPRRQELDPRIDFDPRARYWRQERNGMWIRVALITMIFGVDQNILLPEL